MYTESEHMRRMMSSGRVNSDSTPICRCRVLYLGSAVPQITKDGLQGIQEPLRELYPEQGALGARGIDSWLSVWSNGILLENVDENHKKVTRFFPIESLHYCAAVRYVLVPEKSPVTSSTQPRFLPLDSPFARSPNPNHPPLFACILRRTTGIKVLECHTFICKREMAANALVRCCFHAYADSAYAKHIDNGGNTGNSVYGTLRHETSSNSIEKVEGWRRMAGSPGPGGSTLTLDSAHHSTPNQPTSLNRDNSNSADDISIYNGDENHKIWAGSQRDVASAEEAIYGEYASTMRSSRSIRPRQVINAPPPPPPPSKEEKRPKKSKEKASRKKGGVVAGGSREEMYPPMNGSLMRAGTWRGNMSSQGSVVGYPNAYANGTVMRPASQMMNGGPPPPPVMVPMTLPHKPPKGFRPSPPVMMPPHPIYGPLPPRKHYQVTMEEPVYMPSARPMSPVSSYQPCHFPHEAYLMQHYATMDYHPKRKAKDKKYKNNHLPMPLIITNGRHDGEEWSEIGMYHKKMKDDKSNGKTSSMSLNAERRSDGSDSPFNSEGYHKKRKDSKQSKSPSNGVGSKHDQDEDSDGSPFNTGMYKRKSRKKSKESKPGKSGSNGTVSKEDQDEDSDGSAFNTGIYKRKGHLNERAFSYSIRQEHRSRSYGSLANLKFAPLPVVPNGGGPPLQAPYYGGSINKEEMKKEREIMQMMQDLDLSADELDRPPIAYQSKQRPPKIRT